MEGKFLKQGFYGPDLKKIFQFQFGQNKSDYIMQQ